MSDAATVLTIQDIIPEELFGRDHWSTLAYVETVCVERHFFVIQRDPRMRTDSHNRRIWDFRSDAWKIGFHNAVLGHKIEGSRLIDGRCVPCHDDWDCIQDMAHAGYFKGDARAYPFRSMRIPRDREARKSTRDFLLSQIDENGVDLGAHIRLLPRGFQVAAALRQHKAQGGNFATFRPPPAQAQESSDDQRSTKPTA